MTTRRYALEFAPKAVRTLPKLDRLVVERIRTATEALRDEPRPPGAKMLTGAHGVLADQGFRVTIECFTRSTTTNS